MKEIILKIQIVCFNSARTEVTTPVLSNDESKHLLGFPGNAYDSPAKLMSGII